MAFAGGSVIGNKHVVTISNYGKEHTILLKRIIMIWDYMVGIQIIFDHGDNGTILDNIE